MTAAAPLVGFRAFKISQPAADIAPTLAPIVHGDHHQSWQPGTNRASCSNRATNYQPRTERPHSKPLRSCSCGFHAYATLSDLMANREDHGHVYAAVIGYGKVIEHVDGWRSEFAEVVAIIASPDLRLRAIADRYAVPIVTIDHIATVASEFGDLKPTPPPLHVSPAARSGDALLTGSSGIVRDRLKLQRNTYARRDHQTGDVIVRFHSTDIVTIHPDGSRTLTSGGYHTMTTKDRIGTYGGVRLWSDRGDWVVNGTHQFRDGMTIAAA